MTILVYVVLVVPFRHVIFKIQTSWSRVATTYLSRLFICRRMGQGYKAGNGMHVKRAKMVAVVMFKTLKVADGYRVG